MILFVGLLVAPLCAISLLWAPLRQNHKRAAKWLLLVFVGAMLVANGLIYAGGFYARAKLSEGLGYLTSIRSIEDAYHKEFGHFIESPSEFRKFWKNDLSNFKLLLEPADLDADLVKKLSPKDVPYVTRDGFQILMIYTADGSVLKASDHEKPQPLKFGPFEID